MFTSAVGDRITGRAKAARICSGTARNPELIKTFAYGRPANSYVGRETEARAIAHASYQTVGAIGVGVSPALRLAALRAAASTAAVATAALTRAIRSTSRADTAVSAGRTTYKKRVGGVVAQRRSTNAKVRR